MKTWKRKDLIREYTTPEGRKVREVGPMVYWYSMIVGADGKPRIREFGNVKPSRLGFGGFTKPEKNAAFFAVPVKRLFGTCGRSYKKQVVVIFTV